ncbi:MAG: hypothetical protein U5Q44_06960 [Dehalococcoidia bacterium]|nr:hypothetical protein [Dehalococcoidia bacterium]
MTFDIRPISDSELDAFIDGDTVSFGTTPEEDERRKVGEGARDGPRRWLPSTASRSWGRRASSRWR